MAEPTPLGPWPLGVDNVHAPGHAVFQLPGKDGPAPRLVQAQDVDLLDDGWVRSRLPAGAVAALTTGLGLWSTSRETYVQDGAVLRTVSASTALVSGLTRRVAVQEFGRLVYVTDGTTHWELDGTTARTWGLPVPALTLATTAGTTFGAGTYLVRATFSDARGNEGGCSNLASITLTGAANIEVTLTGGTTYTTKANLYVGTEQQPTTSFSAQATLTGPTTTTTLALPTTIGDPPRTRLMQGPPAGLIGLTDWRAHLLGWRDNVVFLSEAAEPHLFHQESVWQFGADVRAAQGLVTGVWVGTAHGLYWVSGEDRFSVVPKRVTQAAVLAGSTRVDGSTLPALQVADPVALFVARDGLHAGLPSGEVVNLTRDRYHFTSGSRASFAYAVRDDLRQLLIAVN